VLWRGVQGADEVGMRREQPRLQPTTTAIDELLRGADYPEAVRRAVALALRGGRWPKQRCLKCGRRADCLNAWVPEILLSPLPPEDPRIQIRLYWLCLAHRRLNENAGEVRALLGGGSVPL
jgi:hypothetical protein